jgi:RNA polymerase sigma-70 factor (ECF subfamily)
LIKQNVQHDIAFAHSIGVRDSNIDRAFKRYRQTGDPAWMAQVFDATAGELMRLGWHLTGDRHLAEDLVQATFLVAMEDAEAFTDERRIMPWLCGILANRARQLRRQARGRARHTIEPRTDVVDPVSEAATQELQAEVSQALRGLPEPYRQVLHLHLQHGLSGAETADALARPAATIRSQVHRGLEMLRKALPAIYAGVALTAVPTACLAAMRRSLFGPPTVLKSVGSLALILTKKKLSLVAGVGNSNCGLDHPNPTQPQSHPRDTRSTRPFHGASHGKPSARNTRSIESGS